MAVRKEHMMIPEDYNARWKGNGLRHCDELKYTLFYLTKLALFLCRLVVVRGLLVISQMCIYT